jgi:hypothetical protein
MTKTRNVWAYDIVWLALMVVIGASYAAGYLTVGTLVSAEGAVLVIGAIARMVWHEMREPDETVEQLIYRTEHPASSH